MERLTQKSACLEGGEEEPGDCHLRNRWNLPTAFQVFHIGVDLVGRHYSRRMFVEGVGNTHMAAVEGEAGGNHNQAVEEVVRSFEVDSNLAGVGTAVVELLHILRYIQIQGSLTCRLEYGSRW